MNWKEFVGDYLTFTRRDRIAVIAIITILGIIFFLPKALSMRESSKPVTTDTAWITKMKNLAQKEIDNDNQYSKYNNENSSAYQYDRSTNNYHNKSKGELFFFDPNTLSTEGWQKLGLREKTIGTIQNYLGKGGKFRKPEDLQRVYGLFPNEFERIAAYIRIESSGETSSSNYNSAGKYPENQEKKTSTSRFSMVDINSADANTFIELPGIGSSFSARIIKFRDKLGGFYSIDQVGETYGLPDSTFQKIKQYLKLENTAVKKININTATIDELKDHPYIRYSLANPIVAYRNLHGPFAKLEDIKKVMVVTDEIFKKITPYLIVQ